MKKISLLIVVMSLFLGVTACGSKKTEEGSGNKSIYFITDKGGIDDRSFNQGSYEGIKKAVAETPGSSAFDLASKTTADYLPNLTAASEKKPALVIAAGYLLADSMLTAAKNNPEQQYLLIDSPVMENGVQIANVASVAFAEQEGSYLVGVAAATHAKENGKDTVGFMGGEEGALITRFEVGFVAGVKSVDPEMKVLVDYVGDFADVGKGKTVAAKMYGQGAYIIFHAAGGSGGGLIAEAKSRYESGEDVWVIGVDRDQYSDGMVGNHSIILTSMIKRVDTASYEYSKAAFEGEYKGGEITVLTLKDDGVGIPKENPNLTQTSIQAVEEATEKIISGEIEVPSTK